MSTTITSLLNALQSHLQSQTQLLPTLHNQLGLPPTALADDLSILEKELTECVERQVSARREQVDEWMEKCDEVETCCIRYGRALGNHVKATGSSVGEIRKEQVLPRRFEMITEYQEKLRQLYHTKLEQLLTLTNRIAGLSRTLGPEFFPLEILEPVIADEEDELEPDAHRDVSPERFSKLEKELVRGKSEVGKRLHHLSTTLVQIDYLYSELGIPPPSIDDYVSASTSTSTSQTNTRPPSSCGMLTISSNTTDPFLVASLRATTPTPMTRNSGKGNLLFSTAGDRTPPPPHITSDTDHQRVFARFIARLEELGEDAVSDPAKPSIGLEGVEPTPALLAWAERTQHELDTLKRKRESHIQAMYDQLESLWKRMSVPEREMDEFVEANRGSTEETIRAYEEELDRMLELKRERMSTFVENARAEIEKLWEDLMVGETERADFAPFADDEHTEELLAIHEEEIRRLKEERRMKGTLLTNIRKYFDICQEEKDLAAAAADQTRLLGRGPRDPGRLLREEKMRKRVTKEKPRLEQDLLASIPAWEEQTGRPFLVHGTSILQTLLEASTAPEKENPKRKTGGTRAGSAPPRGSKPPSSTSSHTNATAGPSKPATRPASSLASSSSSTRNKLNESTNSQPPGSAMTTRSGSTTRRTKTPPPPPPPRTTSKHIPPRPTPTTHTGAGGGRVPNTNTQRSRAAFHPYPQTRRAAAQGLVPTPKSTAAKSSKSTSKPSSFFSKPSTTAKPGTSNNTWAVMGSVAMNGGGGGGGVQRRAKRESFKPRPSVDAFDSWAAGGGGGGVGGGEGQRRWAGFAPGGAVVEEDEDF